MPKDLHSLICAAINECEYLIAQLELLKIASEQLELLTDDYHLRLTLLIGVYLANAECHYGELSIYLRRAKQLASQEVSSND